MATKTIALSTVPERVSVLETKVDNIEEKIDNLKVDVKEMHDCLDQTRDGIMSQLEKMHSANVTQHGEMADKIKDLEQFKQKWVYLSAGAVASLGWITAHSDKISKFMGL
jgi:hypothetical protein